MADTNTIDDEGGLLTAKGAVEFLFPEWIVDQGLTLREAIFADIYSRTLNSVDAYRDAMAGAENPLPDDDNAVSKAADRFLRRRKLSHVLSRLIQERTGLPTVWLVDKLAAIASTDIADIFEWDDAGNPTIKASKKLTLAQRAAIQQMERDPETGEIKIKLHNKIDALDKLARLNGLFRDNLEVTGPAGGPVKVILSKEDQQVL